MDPFDTRDQSCFIHSLQHSLNMGDNTSLQHLLSLVNKGDDTDWDLKEDETILHVAIKMRTSCHVISALVDAYPSHLTANRANSNLYCGQTALHIALTVGDNDVIELLLRKAQATGTGEVLDKVLGQCATGTRFDNTVMQGELPLSVAALTLNTKLLDTVLSYGAKLDNRNSVGDNLCHSLIKYSHLYPEKCTEVMKMFDHIAKKTLNSASLKLDKQEPSGTGVNISHIWVAKNNAGFNPLMLAAELGQHAIFKFIMELRHVYCHVNSEDGLFDVELYDVTDIDLCGEIIQTSKRSPDKDTSKVFPYDTSDGRNLTEMEPFDPKVPTLELIFKNDPGIVFKFIQLSPLRYVINRKWRFYRWFYTIWGVIHMLFMIGYTVYAIRRSEMTGTSLKHKIGSDVMVTLYFSVSVLFAVVYLAQEILRIIKGKMPWNWDHVMNCYHNGPFRLMLSIFSISIIADVIWKVTDDDYRDYFLICSVILGWWFIVFFLRGFKQFSFFTVMIQKVLVGDMFRFSIIIGMELVAFTTGMLIAFREMNPPEETVQNFSRLMVQMFKMMFGFTALDVLFDARQPWLTVCLYVGFVLLTYVLMVNSLIAMMSNTCSVVSQNRELQYRLQQLSIILFFESIFPPSWVRIVGEPRSCSWYNPDIKGYVSRKRLFMEVRSLREVTRSKARQRMTSESMLESIFNTLRNIQIPLISEEKKETAEAAVGEEPVTEGHTELMNAAPAGDVNESLHTHRNKKKKKSRKKPRERPDYDYEERGVTDSSPKPDILTVSPIPDDTTALDEPSSSNA